MKASQVYLLISLLSLFIALILFITRKSWLQLIRREEEEDWYPEERSSVFLSFLSRAQGYVRFPGMSSSFEQDLEDGKDYGQ